MIPFIRFFDLQIPTYFVIISFVTCLVIALCYRFAFMQNRSVRMTLDLILVVLFSGFLGSRLMHVFYEQPDYYLKNPSQIFYFWQGGFVFYGGALAAFVATYLFCLWKKESFASWADFFTPFIALSNGLGRISCLLAGCCYGKECRLFWAIHFPVGSDAPVGLALHPTQIYMILWELTAAAFLFYFTFFRKKNFADQNIGLLKKDKTNSLLAAGTVFALYAIWQSIGRLWIENFRDDFRGEFILGFSISSWISILIFCAAVGFLLNSKMTTANGKI